MAADKLNKKLSGAFTALIAAASRFDLVTNKKGQLRTSSIYRDYKLAYSSEEANNVLRTIFLRPTLFQKIFERFQGRELPVAHFEKLLIREFDVPEAISSRVARYFIDGAKQSGLLGANNVLSSIANKIDEQVIAEDSEADSEDYAENTNLSQHATSSTSPELDSRHEVPVSESQYSVRIKGPGIDSVIVVNEQDDLIIVEAMLQKIKKKLADSQPERISFL